MKLELTGVSFGYSKEKTVIKDLNFEAVGGDLIAILGPNGAGKTTLLRCLLGYLKWDSGETLLDGKNAFTTAKNDFRRAVSYVPQAKGTYPALTVLETVLLGRLGRRGAFSRPTSCDIEACKRILEELGISHLAESKCTEISGGELQMVLIARALAGDPQILILDEPESNLDFKNQLTVLDTMSRLAGEGMCCIFNTHYPAHALMRANKSLLLSRGGEYVFGETSETVTERNIERVFGVRAAIGNIETEETTYKSVVPIGISSAGGTDTDDMKERAVIAVVSIISRNSESNGRINSILHEFSEYLVGRMGIPKRERGMNLISITAEAPLIEIEKLTHRLSIQPGVSVKSVISDGEG